MRKCFLHIGTHKTGTSAIQRTLNLHSADLAKRGFLYPRAGTIPGLFGHHNIAWEIAGHPYFQSQAGTVDELIAEIRHSTHDVVLSSEDFILALPREAAFHSFIERLKQCALQITILVYFRNAPDYFRSAYFEILKAECPFGFAQFISAMIENKTLRWGTHAAGGIDVIGYLQQLATDTDLKIIARSYDQVRACVVLDFLSALGLTPSDLGEDTETRANERPTIGDAFSLFYQNRTGRAADAPEAWLISCLARSLEGQHVDMSSHARRMLLDKYQHWDEFLSQYSINGPTALTTEFDGSNSDPDRKPCLEEVFSETTIRLIETTAQRLTTEFQAFKSIQPAVAP